MLLLLLLLLLLPPLLLPPLLLPPHDCVTTPGVFGRMPLLVAATAMDTSTAKWQQQLLLLALISSSLLFTLGGLRPCLSLVTCQQLQQLPAELVLLHLCLCVQVT